MPKDAFCAQVVILEHKSIICAGYSAVCHIHSVAEEVTVKLLIGIVDKKTNTLSKKRPRFVKQDQVRQILPQQNKCYTQKCQIVRKTNCSTL